MFKARVEMCLKSQTSDHAVVVAVDVGVNTVQTLEDLLDCRLEVGWEGHARLGWEQVRV